jgi:hypothetical protein
MRRARYHLRRQFDCCSKNEDFLNGNTTHDAQIDKSSIRCHSRKRICRRGAVCLTGSSHPGLFGPDERIPYAAHQSLNEGTETSCAPPLAVARSNAESSEPLRFYAVLRHVSGASVNHESRVSSSIHFQKHKMLRYRQHGFNPFLPFRTNLDISAEIVCAVKGDALIHGPYMAARPVGSDWRTRRPSKSNQTNC